MNLRLKLTTSLAAFCFAASSILASDETITTARAAAAAGSPSLLVGAPSSSSVVLREGERMTSRPSQFLQIETVKDKYADSVSFTMRAQSEARDKLFGHMRQDTKQTDVRRILQLDGGGVRDEFSIFTLCFLEAIINHPDNQDLRDRLLEQKKVRLQASGKMDDVTRLYIRDLFDVGTGTSTGAILTAALFSDINLSAIDVAKLYARYGYKIFDEQKRFVMPGLGVGLTSATYDNSGLSSLLIHYFRNAHLQHVHKPIYLVALNEGTQEAAVLSSEELYGDDHKYHHTHLSDAVLYSASAPSYLPGVQGVSGNGRTLYSDGGTVANNSAALVLDKETRIHLNPYEIFSFGTGVAPAPVVRSPDTGAMAVATILINTLVAQEKLALTRCIDEMHKLNSQLQFFARINPLLETGMDKLDDTSETYVQYALKKAFSIVQGPAFAEMVARLGFVIPDLVPIQKSICDNLNALKSNKFSALDPYEKEFVMRKVIELDFKFYAQRLYKDLRTGELRQIEDVEGFLKDVTLEMAQRKLAGDGVLSRLLSWVSTSKEDKIVEFIPRCMEFHKLSIDQNTLSREDFALLLQDQVGLFTHEQLKTLSPEHTINGDGWFWSSVGTPQPGKAAGLVLMHFRKFVDLCEKDDAHFKYDSSSGPYVHLPALIYWKNAFHQLEDKLTRQDLMKIYRNLESYVAQIMSSRAYTNKSAVQMARSTRYEVLLQGLLAYINKFYKE